MEHDHTLQGRRLASLLYFDHMNASLVGAPLHRQRRVFLAGHPLTSLL
jgi:hypothetical protein